ncbi:RNA polymerase sigma-70 factor [Fulvivirga imtechensis AK7]|uniref:RNA polymerase sigma-70 factor n=1 Tax=Fulvivirga imtechensis AK7 TaxID=1237149 RepID=L8JLG2_9BACT|nr:sigma-70 family RNA polymerase sigma factor [Fulvivirga imtechensis]ELR69655.1 RNA polymerase sigma-70 factor [Fulvivirga imtechensis AK7]
MKEVDILQESSDNAIIRRIVNGSKHEFELLIRRFNQQLFRIGVAYLKDEHDVQDAMQSAYLKAYEKLPSFRAESTFSTWLIRIMINECLLLIRKNERQEPQQNHDYLETYEPDGAQALITTEMKEILEKAILTLPEKYRAVYIFRALNEYSTLDTAEYLGLTTENVKVRFHRAKQLLKDEILKQTGTIEAFSFLGKRCEKLTQAMMKMIR